MKSFFKKAEGGLKKAFSKQAVNDGLSKLNKAYLSTVPIAKITGQLANGIAPVAAMTGVGIPLAVGLKAGGLIANGYASGDGLAKYIDKNNKSKHKALPVNSIQAPKPEEKQPANDIFY